MNALIKSIFKNLSSCSLVYNESCIRLSKSNETTLLKTSCPYPSLSVIYSL